MNFKVLKFHLRVVYAVTQFVGQTLMTTYGLCIFIAYVIESIALVRAAHYALSYIVDIQSLTGPICLFLMRYARSI